MIKICCNLGRNQIFGDIFFYQFQMSKFFSLEGGGGEISPAYRSIGETEGQVWKTNILLRVALEVEFYYL